MSLLANLPHKIYTQTCEIGDPKIFYGSIKMQRIWTEAMKRLIQNIEFMLNY